MIILTDTYGNLITQQSIERCRVLLQLDIVWHSMVHFAILEKLYVCIPETDFESQTGKLNPISAIITKAAKSRENAIDGLTACTAKVQCLTDTSKILMVR